MSDPTTPTSAAPTLSTGQPSTLGVYLSLARPFFGEGSPQVRFILDKIAASPNGADEAVLADESQMILLLRSLG